MGGFGVGLIKFLRVQEGSGRFGNVLSFLNQNIIVI